MIEPLAVPSGSGVLDLLPRLARSLDGNAPIAPYAGDTPPPHVARTDDVPLPDGLALVIGTSGSTGTPKRALLTAAALTASGTATHDRLGGPGQWLLALPAHHIAGLQVLLRSLLAGTTPVVLDQHGGFTAAAFTAATERLDRSHRQYTSLVPTQLRHLLTDPRATDSLRGFEAILVGGSAISPLLREECAAAGVTITATYGMSETAGGAVYDGRPLGGAHLRIDADQRVHLGGTPVAHGYLGRPDLTVEAFSTDDHGTRWFRTDDAGHLDDDGRLHIDGRLDDLINTGGLKVAPRLVEEAIARHVPGVREVLALGVPDDHWGEAVSVLLVLATQPDHGHPAPSPTVGDLRAALRGILPDHALPHRVRTVDVIPATGPGKPDRRGARDLFAMGE